MSKSKKPETNESKIEKLRKLVKKMEKQKGGLSPWENQALELFRGVLALHDQPLP